MANAKRLATFKKLFEELLKDLEVIRPGDPSLILVKTASSFLSAETLHCQFMECVEDYKSKILARDEDFFLKDLNVEVQDEFITTEINRIKDIWRDPNTSGDDKECIWKYLILLVKIGEKIIN